MKKQVIKALNFIILITLLKVSYEILRCEKEGEFRAIKDYKCIPKCLSSTGTGKYFTDGLDSDDTTQCYSLTDTCDTSNNVIINPTGECYQGSNCPQGFYMSNKICYENGCPENTELAQDTAEKKCKCKYKFDGEKCLGENDHCPTERPYFNEETKECSNTLCSDPYLFKRKIIYEDGEFNFQCVETCDLKNEFESSGECVAQCPKEYPYYFPDVRKCQNICNTSDSTGIGFMYNKTKTCYLDGNNCPSNYMIFEFSITPSTAAFTDQYKLQCVDSCPEIYPFLYEKLRWCVDSCHSLETYYLNAIKFFSYIGPSAKNPTKIEHLCVADCSKKNDKPYVRENKECVECNGFTVNNICYENKTSCQDINVQEDLGLSWTNIYHIVGTKKCVDLCPSDYDTLTAPKLCISKVCKDNPTQNYFNIDYLDTGANGPKCVACNETTDKYVPGLKICSTGTIHKCPVDFPYHRKDGRECFASDKGCKGILDGNYKFYFDTDPYECLMKCSDGGSWNFLTEDYLCLPTSSTNCPASHPCQYGKQCLRNCPVGTYIFYNDDGRGNKLDSALDLGVKLCLKESECIESNYNYIQGNGCSQKCDIMHPYKIKPKSTEPKLPGYCLENLENCIKKGYIYFYNNTEAPELICVKNCSDISDSYLSIEIDPNSSPLQPYQRDGGTCVTACPDDYPYLYEKVCYKNKCPELSNGKPLFFVTDTKKCVTECTTTKPYILEEEKNGNKVLKCVSECPKEKPLINKEKTECVKNCGINEYISKDGKNCLASCDKYYNNKTHECADSCSIFKDFPFTPYETPTKALPCLSECPSGYFFKEADKNCIKTCKYPSSENPRLCLTYCKDGKKYDKDKGVCVDDCNGKFYYSSKLDTENTNPPHVIREICTNTCEINDAKKFDGSSYQYKFALNSSKQCVEKCTQEENYVSDKVCYSKCPEATPYYFLDSTKEYYNCYKNCEESGLTLFHYKDGKECFDNCAPDKNYVIYGTNECLQKCPPEYPIVLNTSTISVGSSTATIQYCSDKCDIGKVSVNNVCKQFCNENGEGTFMFYEEINRTCLSECPKEYPYYEKTQNTNTHDYYKCLSSCNGYSLEEGECYNSNDYQKCTLKVNYISTDKQCKKICNENESYYVLLYGNNTNKYYQCLSSCEGYFVLSDSPDSKECYTTCPDGYYSSPDSSQPTCYRRCYNDSIYKYSVTTNEVTPKKLCKTKCDSHAQYYNKDLICNNACDEKDNYIIAHNFSCVSKCDDPLYPYLFLDNKDSKWKCTDKCPDTYFISNNKTCVSQCNRPFNYIRPGNICADSCDMNNTVAQFAYKPNDESISTYTCLRTCPSNEYMYYYEDQKICLSSCGSNYILEGTHICVVNCTQKGKYFYTPTDATKSKQCVTNCKETKDKNYTLSNNTCGSNCKELTNRYFLESDLVCLEKCPIITKGVDGKKDVTYNETEVNEGIKCVNYCPSNLFLDENGKCIADCSTSLYGYVYFTKEDRVCLADCPKEYYKNSHECTKRCPKDKPYLYDDTCVDNCTSANNGLKKYFVSNYSHGQNITDEDIQPVCLTDCPKDYPYYISENFLYKCLGECPSNYPKIFIDNSDVNKTSIECKITCNDTTKYTFGKECYTECPKGYYYKFADKDKSENRQLYKDACPEGFYRYNNSNECSDKCENEAIEEYIDYSTGICVPKCKEGQLKGKFEGKKYCLDKCDEKIGKFKTYDGYCLKDCSDATHKNVSGVDANHFYFANLTSNECECQSLYYIDEEGIKKCFDYEAIKDCSKNSDSNDERLKSYTISEQNTKRCINSCKGVLSPDNVCIEDIQDNIDPCPAGTTSSIAKDASGFSYRKCKCNHGSYENSLKKTICMEENEKCPNGYNYIIPDDKVCSKSVCSGANSIPFLEYCLKETPPSTTWYKDASSTFTIHFLPSANECSSDYPYMIDERKKECVKSCLGTDYSILSGNKCVKNCVADGSKLSGNTVAIPADNNSYKDIANFICECKNLWYFDKNKNKGVICSSDSSKKSCQQLEGCEYKYLIKLTKQCVEKCPDGFYSFNNECFQNCEDASKTTLFTLKAADNDKKECLCPNLWKKKFNSETKRFEIECQKSSFCEEETGLNYLIIAETGECYPGTKCPIDYPYQFNDACYKENGCPIYTKPVNSITKKCVCKNLWYEETYEGNKKKIHCLDESYQECPVNTFKYEVVETKQCLEANCPDGNYYEFNYKCYLNRCPTGTTETPPNTKKCECNKVYGFWYKELINERYIYTCEQKKCPEKGKNKWINETNECVYNCQDTQNNQYQYGNTCVNVCPNLNTQTKADNSNVCQYARLELAQNLEDVGKAVDSDILTIYNLMPGASFVYDNEKIPGTLHIYSLSLDDYELNQLSGKNNLTSINLDKCLRDIYNGNDMTEDEKIIVTTFDIYTGNPGYIINTFEYNFYSSKTGKKIDVSLCEQKNMEINYPIKYYLDNSGKIYNETEVKRLKNLFNVAKELKKENEDVDLFNYESLVYHDICVPLSIDGKDVTLTDRRNILFPNVTLCENNCTPLYIDYDNERIHCSCQLKTTVDFNRKNYPAQYNFTNDETKSLQKGPTNLPTMKCIKNLSKDTTNTIKENVAFYYTVIITAVESGLVVVSFLYSYKLITSRLSKKLKIKKNNQNNNNKNDEELSKISQETDFNNAKKEENNGPSSRRNLGDSGNPPKKYFPDDGKDEKGETITIKKYPAKKTAHLRRGKKDDDDDDDENNNNDNNEIFEEENIDNKDNKDNKEEEDEENQYDFKEMDDFEYEKSFITKIQAEKKILVSPYDFIINKEKSSFVVMLFTEIFDKIYLSKTFLFYDKHDMISLLVSLYLLYHVLLLTLMALFFNVNTISKIYTKENFPSLGNYLLFGFIGMLILWVVYKLLICLIKNNEQIERLMKKSSEYRHKGVKNAKKIIQEKYDDMLCSIKAKMIAFFVIEFVLLIFCFIYLVTFCGVYISTRKYVFYAYGISLIEIAVIKIVYSLILSILRKVSLSNKIRCLYNVVKIFNIYLD